MKIRLSILLFGLLLLLITPLSAKEPPPYLIHFQENPENLKAIVEPMLKIGNNVIIRGEIGFLWDYVDLLQKAKNFAEMEKYLEVGLDCDPWNLKYQLVLANLKLEKGLATDAENIAKMIAEKAEDTSLINDANFFRNYLVKSASPRTIASTPSEAFQKKELDNSLGLLSFETEPFENISRISPSTFTIIIVPIGVCDSWLLKRIKEELEKYFNVATIFRSVSMSDSLVPQKNHLIRGIEVTRKKCMEIPASVAALGSSGYDITVLRDDEKFVNCLLDLLKTQGLKAEFFNIKESFKSLARLPDQYDVNPFLDQFHGEIRSIVSPKKVVIGLTKLDLYEERIANFYFGVARIGQGFGVVSYLRFMNSFNQEPPNRERLVNRTFKQVLSTIGNAFGLKKCHNPNCARVYPNSLIEHDAKGNKLCAECAQMFSRVMTTKINASGQD